MRGVPGQAAHGIESWRTLDVTKEVKKGNLLGVAAPAIGLIGRGIETVQG